MKLALITLTMVTAMTTKMTLSTMTQLPRITHLAMTTSMTKVMAMAVMVMATVMTASMTTVMVWAMTTSCGVVLADSLRRRPVAAPYCGKTAASARASLGALQWAHGKIFGAALRG